MAFLSSGFERSIASPGKSRLCRDDLRGMCLMEAEDSVRTFLHQLKDANWPPVKFFGSYQTQPETRLQIAAGLPLVRSFDHASNAGVVEDRFETPKLQRNLLGTIQSKDCAHGRSAGIDKHLGLIRV